MALLCLSVVCRSRRSQQGSGTGVGHSPGALARAVTYRNLSSSHTRGCVQGLVATLVDHGKPRGPLAVVEFCLWTAQHGAAALPTHMAAALAALVADAQCLAELAVRVLWCLGGVWVVCPSGCGERVITQMHLMENTGCWSRALGRTVVKKSSR